MMRKHTPTLHTWTQPLKFHGLEIGTRMSVLDVDGQGTLLVHSPIHLTSEIRSRLDSLGTVGYVIAPNKWHHLYLADFKEGYPQAGFFCAPGLEKKKAGFSFDGVITDSQSFPWNDGVEHLIVRGAPMFNEVAFFHRASRTLFLTDTALHICEDSPWPTRLFFGLLGTYRKFGLSSLEKRLFVKDAAAFRESMKQVGRWDFDRIVLAHGKIVESDGKALFHKAYLE